VKFYEFRRARGQVFNVHSLSTAKQRNPFMGMAARKMKFCKVNFHHEPATWCEAFYVAPRKIRFAHYGAGTCSPKVTLWYGISPSAYSGPLAEGSRANARGKLCTTENRIRVICLRRFSCVAHIITKQKSFFKRNLPTKDPACFW